MVLMLVAIRRAVNPAKAMRERAIRVLCVARPEEIEPPTSVPEFDSERFVKSCYVLSRICVAPLSSCLDPSDTAFANPMR